ncbi:LOW QUALITY PROTEIN: ras association domain-containing protein 10 [Menidia menidia]
MEQEEGKISVWVCREEKLVSGLSRRTTCADVVKVLLEDQNLQQGASAAMLSGPPQAYCLVEKWRGFERILPNKTKVLRLWGAWGAEQENVRFVLLKNEASLPNSGPRSAEARVVPSREGGGGGPRSPGKRRPKELLDGGGRVIPDRQRRVVRKAFRKLDKMNRKREQTAPKDRGAAEKMETLVHLVISQDHTIRQQLQRLQELDRDIERHEARVHLDRVRRHGANYVQDTYLVEPTGADAGGGAGGGGGGGGGGGAGPGGQAEAVVQFREYARRCEEVVRLQEELEEREALVESLTGEIQEELNRRWMKRRRGEEEGGAPEEKEEEEEEEEGYPDQEPDAEDLTRKELVLEEEQVRTQLDTSLYIGLRLKTDLDAVRGDLDLSLALWETREGELLDLLAKVEAMGIEPAPEQTPGGAEVGVAKPGGAEPGVGVEGGWVEEARGLAKASSANDEDSDTGLSSMHSQDSDNPPVCESLV